MGAPHDPTDSALEELAAGPLDPEDAALLNSLRAYVDEHDPVPDGLVERIQFELTLDALHTEVATLTSADPAVPDGARSAGDDTVRTLTFASESLTVLVTVTPESADTSRIDGWAPSDQPVEVTLVATSGNRTTQADADGRFDFVGVSRGSVQLRLSLPGRHPRTVLSPDLDV